MKELLRVSMNERQVREACEQWARSRSHVDGAAANVLFPDAEHPALMRAEVIFTKKRERKAKNGASPPADPTATF
jgi:hypothetical protein